MAESRNRQSDVLFICILFSASIALRYSVSLHPYSGEHNVENRTREDGTPMFGDYEAQRHWMEITRHLPLQEWYSHSKDNDLLYWGLDYPPLTAYHSMLCGYLFERFEPAAVALHSSRGYETPSSRFFMRMLVMVFDLLVYHTAVLALAFALYPDSEAGAGDAGVRTGSQIKAKDARADGGGVDGGGEETRAWLSECVSLGGGSATVRRKRALCAIFGVLSPGLVLIDHGHFQFNSICDLPNPNMLLGRLGLAGWGVALVVKGQHRSDASSVRGVTALDLLGSICFVLALCFKQIALYYAPAFFSYLLGRCFQRPTAVGALVDVCKLGMVVIATFALMLLPWLSLEGVAQVGRRVFPIGRGLFEDKVANVWCAVAPVLRLKAWLPPEKLVGISLGATVVALVPSGYLQLRSPSPWVFVLGLLASSLAFFLFAYQVHEKSILFALLPLALVQAEGGALAVLGCCLNCVALSSMFPLLLRDGLGLAYVSVYVLSGTLWCLLRDTGSPLSTWQLLLLAAAPACAATLHLVHLWVPPPPRYPDLHVLGLMMASAAAFSLAFLATHLLQHRAATAAARAKAKAE